MATGPKLFCYGRIINDGRARNTLTRNVVKTNSLTFLFEPVAATLAVIELAGLLPGIGSCLLTVGAFLSHAVPHCVDYNFCPNGIHIDSSRLGALGLLASWCVSHPIARLVGLYNDVRRLRGSLMIL
jgi:hypothetical protein